MIIRGRLVTRWLSTAFVLVMMYSLVGCSQSGSAIVPSATLSGTYARGVAAATRTGTSDAWGTDRPMARYGDEHRNDSLAAELAWRDPEEDSADELPNSPQRGSVRHVSLRDGLEPKVPSRDWQHIVLHHSGTAQGDVESIDADHRQRRDAVGAPWLGIGYHFVIGNGEGMLDGLIEPTFRWRQQLHGAHAGVKSYNERGIGICLIGDFTKDPPTRRQIEALRRLLDDLSERYNISAERILRHGEIVATECPGNKFPFDEVVHRDVRDAVQSTPPATRRP